MLKNLGFFLLLILIASPCFAQGPTPHVLDKASALALARAQGKLVLVVQGNASCGNCGVFENGTMVTTYNSAPIKELLEEAYVYWYCDSYDYSTAPCNTEILPYNTGLVNQGYDLPLMAVIDPKQPNKFLARLTGAAGPDTFFHSLINLCLNNLEGPLFTNIKDGDTIKDPSFVVTGKSRWVNSTFFKLGIKINAASWKSISVTTPSNPRGQPRSPITWSYQLSKAELRRGSNTIEIRAESSAYVPTTFVSPSRVVTFTYDGP